jgi:TonB family protein
MSIAKSLLFGVVVSIAASLALPQTNAATSVKPGAEILSDTMGIDFGPYMKDVYKTVKQNWYELLPPTVFPPFSKEGNALVRFVIEKDGKVRSIIVDQSAGDVTLDNAAVGAIRVTKFAPLPAQFRGKELELRFSFIYNPDQPKINISPSVNVQVPVGKTQQFSASGKDITNSAVKWSLFGAACSKSECGTISETGLYTAPAEVPNPPTVTIQAVKANGAWASGGVRLTIIEEPSK